MYTYNPLHFPINHSKSIIKGTRKNCWINHTWYNEIKHELRTRWKGRVKKYGELEDERNKAYEKLDKGEVCEVIYDPFSFFSDEEGNMYDNFDVKELEVAQK